MVTMHGERLGYRHAGGTATGDDHGLAIERPGRDQPLDRTDDFGGTQDKGVVASQRPVIAGGDDQLVAPEVGDHQAAGGQLHGMQRLLGQG